MFQYCVIKCVPSMVASSHRDSKCFVGVGIELSEDEVCSKKEVIKINKLSSNKQS